MNVQKLVLDGARVRLEPLSVAHAEALAHAVRDGELWKIRETLVPHPDAIDAFVESAEAGFLAGHELAFAVVDKPRDHVVGSTRLMCIDPANRKAEIGFTFYARSAQRTHVNTEAKYLLLRHAFETWGLNRVELITDARNHRSRAAIARIGARQEGVMRSHMVMRDGFVRDSVLFGLTSQQWPDARRALESMLGRT